MHQATSLQLCALGRVIVFLRQSSQALFQGDPRVSSQRHASIITITTTWTFPMMQEHRGWRYASSPLHCTEVCGLFSVFGFDLVSGSQYDHPHQYKWTVLGKLAPEKMRPHCTTNMENQSNCKRTWKTRPKNILTGIDCKAMFSADILWLLSVVSRYHCHE